MIKKNSNQKFNLDRRMATSDRRVDVDRRINEYPNYKGPTCRYTIDRRLNLKDRREES